MLDSCSCGRRILIVSGSPHASGNTDMLAESLAEALGERDADSAIYRIGVNDLDISPCIGCNKCRNEKACMPFEDTGQRQCTGKPQASQLLLRAGDLGECESVKASDACMHRCFMDDDMRAFRKYLDWCDELHLVCPLYFSGPPAQMKAVMDRLQPYFWSNLRKAGQKRPLYIYFLGEKQEDDPYGCDPLITIARSSFGVAGFRAEQVYDWRDVFADIKEQLRRSK